MVSYGLSLILLICKFKKVYPTAEHFWYADGRGVGSKFACIHNFFIKLMGWGHNFGYFPEPTKSILVTLPKNIERAKAVFGSLGFQIIIGNCYLGGFIEETDLHDEWIQQKTND
jgi:hypothetical protein